MPHYKYKPIHHLQHAFRLVHLRGGTESEVFCHLVHASLEEESLMPYEALSYTWGSAPDLKTIDVDGQDMNVTTNLHSALTQLRYPNRDRILWIDAVCINQGNDAEKCHQVQQMKTIYHKAEQVIIWLGDSDENTTVLMESLGVFQKAVRGMRLDLATKARWMAAWRLTEAQVLYRGQQSLTSHTDGLCGLLTRPWFRRCWIIQEVANARRATVYCGQDCVSSKIFAISAVLLDVKISQHCEAILELMTGPSNRPTWWLKSRDLFTLVYKFGGADASIGRDRVYALLGILDFGWDGNTYQNDILADYEASEESVVGLAVTAMFGKLPINMQLPPSVKDLAVDLDKFSMEILEGLLASNYMKDAEILVKRMQHITPLTNYLIESPVDKPRIRLNWESFPWQYDRNIMKVSFSTMERLLREQCSGHVILQFILETIERNPQRIRRFFDEPRFLANRTILNVGIDHSHFTVTGSMLELAAQHQHADILMAALIKHLPTDITIKASVLEAVVQNMELGVRSLQILLDHRAENYQISAEVVRFTLAKAPQMLGMLVECVKGPRPIEFTITNLILAARDELDGPQRVKEILANTQLTYFRNFKEGRGSLHNALVQSARNQGSGQAVLGILLWYDPEAVTISPLLLDEIAKNLPCRQQMFETLVENNQIFRNNWLAFILAAKRKELKDLRDILDERGLLDDESDLSIPDN